MVSNHQTERACLATIVNAYLRMLKKMMVMLVLEAS